MCLAMNWNDALVNIVGRTPPEDSLELRNSFIESVMTDQDGNKIQQAQLHLTMQEAMYRWEKDAIEKNITMRGMVRAPYNSGKSQQVPIGLSAYMTTRKHELETLIISADSRIAIKRILALRSLFAKDEYKYWCKTHNFDAVELDRTDTGSTQRIIVRSKNDTGNPTFEAHGVFTETAGQRAGVLILDDVCNDEDRVSRAHRENVWSKVSNIWIKRVHDRGIILSVSTPYHQDDANSRLKRSGMFNVLEIAVKEDKSGYECREWFRG